MATHDTTKEMKKESRKESIVRLHKEGKGLTAIAEELNANGLRVSYGYVQKVVYVYLYGLGKKKSTKVRTFELAQEGKTVGEIAKTLNISLGYVYILLRDLKLSVKKSTPEAVSTHKERYDGIFQAVISEGKNASQVAREIGVSRQRVSKILKQRGVSLPKKESARGSILHSLLKDELEKKAYTLRKRAFYFGITVQELLLYQEKYGRSRTARFSRIFTYMDRNIAVVKVFKGNSLFQMSLTELINFYESESLKFYGELDSLTRLDKMIAIHSPYMLCRIDQSKPYMVGNVELKTRKELGSRLGLMYGVGPQKERKKALLAS